MTTIIKPKETNETVELAGDEASREVTIDSDALAQWTFTASFEGVVPHLYLDTRGNVTCGVGFLVPNRDALDRYDWRPDIVIAREDFERVRVAPSGRIARFYEGLCHATLTADTMRAHFDVHVRAVAAQLGPWKLETLPRAARVALIDMAFNLGVGGLKKYAKLRAAVEAGRWADAAAECSRRGIGAMRNAATRDLFLSLEPVA